MRELLGASPDLNTLEAQAKMKLVKGAKKVLDVAVPVLESPILMKSPRESSMLESQEEFYDAIMADDPEEEEDDCEENALVNKHQVCILVIVIPDSDGSRFEIDVNALSVSCTRLINECYTF